MKQYVPAILIFLMLFTIGCSRADSTTSVDYIVTGEAEGAPSGCSPKDIAQRFVEMLTAINRDDPNVVDEYFGRKNDAPFEWYSMTEFGKTEAEKRHFVAYTWDDLAAYFEQRYQQHEQLHLERLMVNSWDSERGLVNFGPVTMTRHADDLEPGVGGPESIAEGKGAYHCETKAFVVLSLGMGYEPQAK